MTPAGAADLAALAAAAPDPPLEADAVFGAELPRARAYAGLLCSRGIDRGLLGPREAERVWPRHVMNAAAVRGELPSSAEVIDLGAGAGLPGVPLLLARPDLRMQLVEPLLRRAEFLTEVIDLLQLPATVRRARAEELAPETADAVVARAVAPLRKLIPLALPVIRPGGCLLALKGSTAQAELDEAQGELGRWPHTRAKVQTVGEGIATATIVRVDRLAPASRSGR
ncbi:MAG TPA: 16S rRNA (guanine(527)-N(7))-methyltransferase RsmG [Mycobacteriales bacterium]|nr:16S rRNA (guanine(527)-N(7))-methyltransferase RsmG [Mycobacteriales bacterium]